MPRERSCPAQRRTLEHRAANCYDEGDTVASGCSASVYDSCGTNPTSSTGQYESHALPTMFCTGTGPNTRESDELLR